MFSGRHAPREGVPMSAIVPKLRYFVKQRLLKDLHACRSAELRVRYLIILNLTSGRSARQTARGLAIHNTTVYRVADRFRAVGVCGLLDGREDSGTTKLGAHYLDVLYRLVRSSPPRHGCGRQARKRDVLPQPLQRQTRVRIHVATMSRALALIEAQRDRPRPTVRCPWSPIAKGRRLAEIRRLLATV